MRTFITGLFLLLAAGCNSHVTKNLQKGESNTDLKMIISDTTKQSESATHEATKQFGDTLQASLNFDEGITIDSVESSGIQVKGTLIPSAHGVRINIKAVTKPSRETERTTVTVVRQGGLHGSFNYKSDSSYQNQTVIKESKGANTALTSIVLWLLLIVAVALYMYHNYKVL